MTTVEEETIFPGVVVFAVPGHTEGSVLYIHRERHFFGGDTLAWSRHTADLHPIQTIWYSRSLHRQSMDRLARSGHHFGWVFPGHGDWTKEQVLDMDERLIRLRQDE